MCGDGTSSGSAQLLAVVLRSCWQWFCAIRPPYKQIPVPGGPRLLNSKQWLHEVRRAYRQISVPGGPNRSLAGPELAKNGPPVSRFGFQGGQAVCSTASCPCLYSIHQKSIGISISSGSSPVSSRTFLSCPSMSRESSFSSSRRIGLKNSLASSSTS